MRPAPTADSSAILLVPNVKVRMELYGIHTVQENEGGNSTFLPPPLRVCMAVRGSFILLSNVP
jgi:hypothetical protein